MYQATPGISPLDGAIVENGDKAQHNIAKDKFVNHKGILKKAASAISVGDDLTSTNLIDYTTGNDGKKGVINELSDQIATQKIIFIKKENQNINGSPSSVSDTTFDLSSYVPSGYSIWSAMVQIKYNNIYCNMPWRTNDGSEFCYIYSVSSTAVVIRNKSSWGTPDVYFTLICKKNS